MYKVSILVPIFNVEKYVEKCARSLFGQTYDNLEFVFVDDCSPDKSISILQEVQKEYPYRAHQVKLVRHEHNRGIAASRNTTLEHATGEFFCFVDSDDWLEQNAIELLVERQKSEDADIVYGNALMHASDGVSELREKDYKDNHEMMLYYSRFTPCNTMVLWRRLIRASLIRDHGIREIEGLNYSEDKHLLALSAFYARVVSHLDSVVYHYNRMNEESVVASASKNAFPLSAHLQEIGNMQAVVDFFRDKNEEYFSESGRALLRFLRVCMDEALSSCSKEGFYAMVDCINQAEHVFWDSIGWNTWKRVLYGNYFYMKYFPGIKRRFKHFIGVS